MVWGSLGVFLPSDLEIRSVSMCCHQSSPKSLSQPVGIDPGYLGGAGPPFLVSDIDSMLASTSGDCSGLNLIVDEKPFESSTSALVAGKFVDRLGIGLIPWGVLPQCSSWSWCSCLPGPLLQMNGFCDICCLCSRRPVLKHGPRSLTCTQVTELQ